MSKTLGGFARLFISKKKSITIFVIMSGFMLYKQYEFLKIYGSYNATVFDFTINMLSDKFNMLYIFPFAFVAFIMNFAIASNFNEYLILKYKSKRKYFKHIILTLLIISICFSGFIILLSLFISLPNLKISNSWGKSIDCIIMNLFYQLDFTETIIQYIKGTMTPISIIVLGFILMTSYFFIIGLIYFISSIRIKNGFILFVLANILGLASRTIEVISENIGVNKYLIYNNTIVFTHNLGDFNEQYYLPSIKFSIIGMLIIIMLLFIVGNRVIINSDIKSGV